METETLIKVWAQQYENFQTLINVKLGIEFSKLKKNKFRYI